GAAAYKLVSTSLSRSETETDPELQSRPTCFLCSICLDVFTDPVSTPCGHNFFNTFIREMVD
uniref:Zinc finger RING-type eukaryotic domain-containing protein n=1 Tax=Nothobranchius furzeri TaxID=105023 RepID=A0A8C6LY60_NOTFU